MAKYTTTYELQGFVDKTPRQEQTFHYFHGNKSLQFT